MVMNMGLLGIMLFLVILIGVLVLVRVKHGSFFEPNIRADYPKDLKPFLKMNRSTYQATASPRHKLLPVLEKIRDRKEEDVEKVSVDIIGYKFNYEGYSTNDKWYQTLRDIIVKGGHVRLLGGNPENDETLKNIKALGADIRFLKPPPTAHLFIYTHELKHFIWFEGEHSDNRAICVAYTKHPSEQDVSVAMDYFDSLWKTGESIDGLATA